MKKLLLLFLTASSSFILYAQNDLVVFSEQGEQFYVVIDGVKQNAKPETNVKVTGLKQPMVTAKVIFADGKTPDVDQKIYFQWAGEEKQGCEFSCAVVKKNDVYKIKQRSCAPVSAAPPPSGQTVVVYSTTPPPAIVETTTISTTTTTGGTQTGEHVNVGMNVGGVGMNVNVSVNDGMGTTSTSSTTMTTTTTTSSSSSSNMGYPPGPPPPAPAGNVYVLEGYNGPHNCNWPMSPGDFESAKSSIKSKSFEDSKLTIAKQILGSNCMLSSQVKEVMLLFDFENTRLDFAKFAWGKTFDYGNYYKLNDAFTFESSIDDLNKYIEGKK